MEALVPGGARILDDEPDAVLTVPPGTRTEFSFRLVAPATGRVVLHGLAVRLGGPLGLFEVPLYFPNPLVVKVLPQALSAFIAQDYSMWEAILRQLEVPGHERILAESKDQASSAVLTRDYTGLHRFAQDVGILDQVDFDFSTTVSAATMGDSH